MTDRQYGEILGCIYGTIPGSFGMMGLLIGLRQMNVEKVLVGLFLIGVGLWMRGVIVEIGKRRDERRKK